MIGQNIKKFRIKNSLTQKDLADKLFVTAQAVSRWENGEVEPSISTITLISKIFDITVDELIGNEKEEQKPEVVIEKQYVYDNEVKPVLGVCEACNKPIYEAEDIVRDTTTHARSGVTHVYCKHCHEEKLKAKKALEVQAAAKKRIKSFWIGGIVGAILIISNIAYSVSEHDSSVIIPGIVMGILAFTFISCCILDNNFIYEMCYDIFHWGFVRMPGVIFTLDLNGLIFLLTVKLLFWILGFILATITGIFALIIGTIISVFVYPFALVKNIKHPEICY